MKRIWAPWGWAAARGVAIGLSGLIAAPLLAEGGGLRPPTQEEAPIAFLIDVTNGQVLHQRDADRRFVPASMTKVMTLYTAFSWAKTKPPQQLTLSGETWEQWNGEGSTMWIDAGDTVPVEDALSGIANISANDASVMLAKGYAGSVAAWCEAMNANARELGMVNSHFATPNGWPDGGQTFTSARDLTILARALMEFYWPQYQRHIGQRSFTYGGITQTNYDPLIGRFEGADGIKTGFTSEAGYSYIGSAEREGKRLIMVIAGTTSIAERARIARSYMEWGFAAFERLEINSTDAPLGSVQVQGGDRVEAAVYASGHNPYSDHAFVPYVNVPKGSKAQPRLTIAYDGPIRPPISAKDEIAQLRIEVEGMEPANIPLYAAHSVDEANAFQRVAAAVMRWLS